MGPVISLVNSRVGPSLGILLARVLPRDLASSFADWLAGLAASGVDTPVVRAIRANQAVVRGVPYDHPGLQKAAAEVLQGRKERRPRQSGGNRREKHVG